MSDEARKGGKAAAKGKKNSGGAMFNAAALEDALDKLDSIIEEDQEQSQPKQPDEMAEIRREVAETPARRTDPGSSLRDSLRELARVEGPGDGPSAPPDNPVKVVAPVAIDANDAGDAGEDISDHLDALFSGNAAATEKVTPPAPPVTAEATPVAPVETAETTAPRPVVAEADPAPVEVESTAPVVEVPAEVEIEVEVEAEAEVPVATPPVSVFEVSDVMLTSSSAAKPPRSGNRTWIIAATLALAVAGGFYLLMGDGEAVTEDRVPERVGNLVASTSGTPARVDPTPPAGPATPVETPAATAPAPVEPRVVATPTPVAPVKPVVKATPKPAPVKPVVKATPKPAPVKPVVKARPKPAPVKPVVEATPTPVATRPVETKPVETKPARPAPVVVAPPPKPAEPVVLPPEQVSAVEANISPRDLKRSSERQVVLRVLVNERGAVSRVVVEKGTEGSAVVNAAMNAVLRFKYQSGTTDGEPTKAWVTETFDF